MEYLLKVTTPQGVMLRYTVEHYDVIDGFVVFTDRKTGIEKRYDGRCVEIEGLP